MVKVGHRRRLFEAVTYASAGYCHTIALTPDHVMSFGRGEWGQLGHGNLQDFDVPKVIQSLSGICVCKITTGTEHTAVVTEAGQLLTFVNGGDGRLGHGNTVNQMQPKLVSSLRHECVVGVAAGVRHTMAFTASGDMFTFGRSMFGMLGHGTG